MDVNNKRKFFQNIALDDSGNMIVVLEDKAGDVSNGVSQYNTFKKLQLTESGYLKTSS